MKRARAFLQGEGSTHVLGVVRVGLGVLLFWEGLESAQELLARGYFGDHFHFPYLPEALVPSRSVYTAILAVQLFAAALVTVGHLARPALFFSGASLVYLLGCDRLHYHHHVYALACYVLLLSLSPCERSFAITSDGHDDGSTGPLWAIRLAQLQVSIVYLASGGSKLLDADWRDGLVLLDRLVRYGDQAVARGVPVRVVEFFQQAGTASALAKLAIATELFLAVGLWLPRTRVAALFVGVWFHLAIEVTSKVGYFSWLTILVYALFATHDVRARTFFFDPSHPKGAVSARAVRALDWLGRFHVKAWEPDELVRAHHVVIVRRDGTRATGLRAVAMVARCTPLLFPLWGPLALAASFTKGGDASARS